MPTKPTITTGNREWGFYGTAFRNAQLTDRQCEKVYSDAANELADIFTMTPAEVVAYMDGVNGRHLADSVVTSHRIGTVEDDGPGWLAKSVQAFLRERRHPVPPMPRQTTVTNAAAITAQVLNKLLPGDTIADLLNLLVNAEENNSLTNDEYDHAALLFDAIARINAEAVEAAQNK